MRVNCVAPGGMRTPLTKGFRLPEDADFDVLRPIMSRIGVSEPEEVAECIAYVASDDGALHDRLDHLDRRRPGDLRRRVPEAADDSTAAGRLKRWRATDRVHVALGSRSSSGPPTRPTPGS